MCSKNIKYDEKKSDQYRSWIVKKKFAEFHNKVIRWEKVETQFLEDNQKVEGNLGYQNQNNW